MMKKKQLKKHTLFDWLNNYIPESTEKQWVVLKTKLWVFRNAYGAEKALKKLKMQNQSEYSNKKYKKYF